MVTAQRFQTYMQLSRQVRRLDIEQQGRAGAVQNSDVYRFMLSTTCPPSTSIRFQGGLAWWPAYSLFPAGFYIPSYTVDLSDITKTYGEFKFTNANWYCPALIGIEQDLWPPPEPPDIWPDEFPDNCLYIYRSSDEFETAAEAEVEIRTLVGDRVAYYGVCAGGIIFRNNGNTTEYNQFMAIDPINRGRSYFFGNKKRYGWELA